MEPQIELAPGADDNGLASMLAGLIRQNIEDKPHKMRDFERLRATVAIIAEDAGVSLTLRFDRGRLVVHDGIVGIPDLTIRASGDDIMNLSLVELLPAPVLGALPDLRGKVLRQVGEAFLKRRVKIYGAVTNVPTLIALTRVVSVNG